METTSDSPDQEIYRLAMEAWKNGDYPEAISNLSKLIEDAKGDLGIFYNLRANVHLEAGHIQEALNDFKVSVGLRPQSRLVSSTYFHFLLDQRHFTALEIEGRRYLNAIEHRPEQTPSVQEYCNTIENVLKQLEQQLGRNRRPGRGKRSVTKTRSETSE
jgi:predicted Zn-dependent protease